MEAERPQPERPPGGTEEEEVEMVEERGEEAVQAGELEEDGDDIDATEAPEEDEGEASAEVSAEEEGEEEGEEEEGEEGRGVPAAEDEDEPWLLEMLNSSMLTDEMVQELTVLDAPPGSLGESVLFLLQAGIPPTEIAIELSSGRAPRSSPVDPPGAESARPESPHGCQRSHRAHSTPEDERQGGRRGGRVSRALGRAGGRAGALLSGGRAARRGYASVSSVSSDEDSQEGERRGRARRPRAAQEAGTEMSELRRRGERAEGDESGEGSEGGGATAGSGGGGGSGGTTASRASISVARRGGDVLGGMLCSWRLLTCLAAVVLAGVLVASSIDFVPPLHHAIVYSWLWKTIDPTTLSTPGMVFIGPFNTLYLIPATLQTTTYGTGGDSPNDYDAVWARTRSGLPVVLNVAIQWRYEASALPTLFPEVETAPPTEDAPRLYAPAINFVRHIGYSTVCRSASRFMPHEYFSEKAAITADMLGELRTALKPYAVVVSLQLLRTDVPQQFEQSLMRSSLAQLSIEQTRRMKAARAVEFRTLVLAAHYAYTATLAVARGDAGRRRQLAIASAAMTRLKVDAEIDAFRNVSERLGARVTPHQVLDYAYWQLVMGETSSSAGMPEGRLPLHDILLRPRPPRPQRQE